MSDILKKYISVLDDFFKLAKGSTTHAAKDSDLLRSANDTIFRKTNTKQETEKAINNLQEFRKSQLAVPEYLFDTIPKSHLTTFNDSPENAYYALPSVHTFPSGKQYKTEGEVVYNLNTSGVDLFPTSSHELTHALQYSNIPDVLRNNKLGTTYVDGLKENLDVVRNYQDFIDSKSNRVIDFLHKNNITSALDYKNHPTEKMSFEATKILSGDANPNTAWKYREAYPQIVKDAANETVSWYKNRYPQIHDRVKGDFGKYLTLGGVAVGANALTPEEGESASIPWKTAEKFLENKLGAQYKIIPQESKDNLRKIVSRDIPEEYGLKTPFGDSVDSQFIKKTLVNDNRFNFDPIIMNNMRLGLSATPEEIMSRANLDIKFLDPESASKGNLRPLGNAGFQMGLNPLHPDITGSGLGTVGHEVGHLPQLMKTRQGSFDPELDDKISFVNNAGLLNKAELRTLPFTPADRKSKFYENAKPEDKEIIDRAWQLYEDNSMERVARDMGDLFVKKGRQSDLASLKDYENFKKIYGEISGNAYSKYAEENPELAEELMDRMKQRGMFNSTLSKAALATPFAVAGTQLAGEGEGESALRGKIPSPNTSNVEKSILDFLENRAVRPTEPDTLLRGIPKGGIPETEGGERFVHATPWDNVAKSAGKFAGGETDVYAYDRLPGTKYYRGGSLAGDPLERTAIGDARGITWDDALDKAAGLYDKRVGKSLDELLGYGIKGDELVQHAENAARENAGDVLRDFKRGTYESDAFAKPGIWDGKDVPWGLNKTNPRLRNNFELYDAVVEAEKRGVDRKDIPEARILDSAIEKNPELEKMLTDSGRLYNTVKNAEAKDWIKTPKGMWETAKIALGAIAPGIPAAQAGIKKFVGDEVSKVGKSVKKIVSQTEAGEKANWEDYKNVLNWVDKPGLLLMSHDVAQAVGEPVGKKVAEEISSAYDNFLLNKRREEQDVGDFFNE